MPTELEADELDVSRIIRAGNTVFWGQGIVEPLTSGDALVQKHSDFAPKFREQLKREASAGGIRKCGNKRSGRWGRRHVPLSIGTVFDRGALWA